MMAVNAETAKRLIEGIFESYRHADDKDLSLTLPESVLKERTGKLYEAYILARTLNRLCDEEGFDADFISVDRALKLRQSGGPIDLRYSYFRLSKGDLVLEAWTDIEFLTLSYSRQHPRVLPRSKPERAYCHELDIVVVKADDKVVKPYYPRHDELLIGIECKDVDKFERLFARAVLGIRRELSYLKGSAGTLFERWPSSSVPADPPSVLQVYSTDRKIEDYAQMGNVFGVEFLYTPIEDR
ncbi:hypothetical protein IU429_02785 [Nocardia elegans]|uniref:Uncharacterized protein n=1 Tax=Nocardia elegans TaxID=300029 RepID=A0ABW6TIB3_9NOCA|nr:hypothetical protein [Nocardia elegans]MBF6446587.1 hypothetical protein [Nocardia elegans]